MGKGSVASSRYRVIIESHEGEGKTEDSRKPYRQNYTQLGFIILNDL